ncbi:MAG TPA: DUF1585 domain-containing protein [Bdellovibrionota bacterium]|nr:DUF1585 domain-containing protein [Bdellovibrionota bacterium]
MPFGGSKAIRRLLGRGYALLLSVTLTGCFGLGKNEDAKDAVLGFANALNTELFEQGTLYRTSGKGTFVRLQALSGSMPSVYEPYFGIKSPDPLDVPLGTKERPTNALAQLALRTWIIHVCSSYAYTLNMFAPADVSLLMEGETLPDDPVRRTVFAAARRGWLYPYTADSQEVVALDSLYRGIAADPATGAIISSKEADARNMVCFAVMSAPNFWVGNPGQADVIRRVALEIGRRVPTFTEYSDYIHQKMTLQQYVAQLQQGDGYRKAIRDWHYEWLAFYPAGGGITDIRPTMLYQGNLMGHQGGDLYHFNATKFNATTLQSPAYFHPGLTNEQAGLLNLQRKGIQSTADLPAAEAMGDFIDIGKGYALSGMSSATCKYNQDQDFDPRTSEIRWEHRNPLLADLPEDQQWELVGGWRRKRDSSGKWTADWEQVPGKVTTDLSNGVHTYLDTTVADITYNSSADYTKSWEPFKYSPLMSGYTEIHRSHLIGTPLEIFYQKDRRVRRFGMDGTEQVGTSLVKMPMTGATVRVCNAVDRFIATCALRPNSHNWADFYGGWGAVSQWDASKPQVTVDIRFMDDTLFHPEILDAMRCGVPDMQAMSQLGAQDQYVRPLDDPNELRAWPLGYDGFNEDLATVKPKTNPWAFYIGLVTWYYPHLDSWETEDSDHPEIVANTTYKNDINEEPYRLVDYVITHNLPYREILTANYTFGSEYYEYLLRSQAYYLPGPPPGFTPTFDPTQAKTTRRIEFDSFSDIPLQALRSVVGRYSADDEHEMQGLIAKGHIPHKLHRGLLTTPSFLSAAAPGLNQTALGMRTMSSRYFTRLMCGNPSMVTLTSAQQTLHKQFIPNVEAAAKDHLDPKKGCYACHINLDPLASALSPNFSGGVYTRSYGELKIMTGTSYYQGDYYGIRGGGDPGHGAFLGREMHGLADVSEALADSDQFNSCVVQKAFENITGRGLSFLDLDDFKTVVSKFKSHQSYNQMIIDLVSTPAFSRRN